MYKCRLVYDEWKCILSKERIGVQISKPNMKGYVGLLKINKVLDKQVWRYDEKDVTVCDDDYRWLTIMPSDDYYCITVMMNSKYEMQVCYIDD